MAEVRNEMGHMAFHGVMLAEEYYCFPERYGGELLDNGYYGENLLHRSEAGAEGRMYEVVFDCRFLSTYDIVVYMESDPASIVSRFR